MNIHYGKTTCMLVGTRQRLNISRELNVQIENIRIQNMTKQKLLGIYIDEHLTWSSHIDHLCSILASKISLLRQLRWGSAAVTHIERLSKLQKRAARIILHAEFNTPSDTMFRELGWFSVPNRINFNKAVFKYRALNDLTPEYISTLLKPVSQVHTLNLRSTDNGSLYVPKSRTTIYDGSFSCSAPRLLNTLPHTVRNAGSLNVFKKNMKTHLLH